MQLLNIVKFRYFDPPVFLDVPSVVSQQELYGRAQATSELLQHELTNVSGTQDFYNLEAQGRYIDRPTVSYTPITGDRFINIFLRPIPTGDHFRDDRFRARRGCHSATDGQQHQRPGQLFPCAANGTSRGSQIPSVDCGAPSHSAGWSDCDADDASRQQAVDHSLLPAALKPSRGAGHSPGESLLALNPQRDEFLLTSDPRQTPDAISVRSRSMQQILAELAAGVAVPQED